MRRSFQWLIIIILTGLIGCRQHKEAPPLLAQKQMVPIIYELILSDEYAMQKVLKDSSMPVDDVRVKNYEQVLALHKVSRTDFASSYHYYLRHPDKIKAIYDSAHALAGQKRLELMNPAYRYNKKSERTPVKVRKDTAF